MLTDFLIRIKLGKREKIMVCLFSFLKRTEKYE
jgi:hypothetical protein